MLTVLSTSEASVAFNILSSHANSNLSNRHFSREEILISNYPSILYAF